MRNDLGGTILSTELRSKLHERNDILYTQNQEPPVVFVQEMTTAMATMLAIILKTEIITMQEYDDNISQVLPYLKSNHKPTRRQIMTLRKPARNSIGQQAKLSFSDGVLIRTILPKEWKSITGFTHSVTQLCPSQLVQRNRKVKEPHVQ